MKRRNTLLASMTDEVAQQVLRDNYEQNVLLGNARAQQHAMLAVHERLIHSSRSTATSTAALEFLPSDAEIVAAQQGRPRPRCRRSSRCSSPTRSSTSRTSSSRRRCPTTRGSPRRWPATSRRPLREQVRRADRGSPAAPRDHHQLGRQLDGQPGRHHLRLPRRGGDRGVARAGRPRLRRVPRDLRPRRLRAPRSRPPTTS